MAPMSPVPAARSVSSRMRSFSPAVNVRRLGRSDNSGLAAAGAGTTVGLRPSSVPAPAAAFVSATLLGMTTRQFSYALKSKLPGRLCLIIIGTEGYAQVAEGANRRLTDALANAPLTGEATQELDELCRSRDRTRVARFNPVDAHTVLLFIAVLSSPSPACATATSRPSCSTPRPRMTGRPDAEPTRPPV